LILVFNRQDAFDYSVGLGSIMLNRLLKSDVFL